MISSFAKTNFGTVPLCSSGVWSHKLTDHRDNNFDYFVGFLWER